MTAHRRHLTAADIDAELARLDQQSLDDDHHDQPGDLANAHTTFAHWLGDEYDIGSLDAVLAVAATHHLDGDPPWLLVVSGPGNAKTETVNSLQGIGALAVSTLTSEGALLSATPAKDRTKGATGGLLRQIGPAGILVIKDVTSILSMNKDLRSSVLAALREVYDGRWDRSVGSDGARTLTWQGRIVLVGAVTTAYDAAHSVIASMGDRFALVRTSSSTGRLTAGRHALRNVGHEVQMRAELAAAVAQLMTRHLNTGAAKLTGDDMETLLGVANLVTYARTAVERDYQGNVIDAHAPEMPTRFAKMLGQITRGGLAIGMSRDRALTTAVRVAGDSMPPLRLALLADILQHPYSILAHVQKRLQKPRNTVDRELQALTLLGLLSISQLEGGGSWMYTLSDAVDQGVLKMLVSRIVDGSGVKTAPESTEPEISTHVRQEGPVQTSVLDISTDVRESRTDVRETSTDVPLKHGPEKSVKVLMGFEEEPVTVSGVSDFSGPDLNSRKIDTGVRETLATQEENPERIEPPTPNPDAVSTPGICPDCQWPRNTRGHLTHCLNSKDPA